MEDKTIVAIFLQSLFMTKKIIINNTNKFKTIALSMLQKNVKTVKKPIKIYGVYI